LENRRYLNPLWPEVALHAEHAAHDALIVRDVEPGCPVAATAEVEPDGVRIHVLMDLRPHHESGDGIVSRVSPVHTVVRNCTRDEGGPFEFGNQVLISSHRKLLSSKATVVNVAEKSEQDFDRHD
jgi:hypothetical protein